MYKTFLTNYSTFVFVLFFASSCHAQNIEVQYEETRNIDTQLEQIPDPSIRAMVAQKLGKQKSFTLRHSQGCSSYNFVKNKEEEITSGGANVTMMGGGEDVVYKNQSENLFLCKTNFMGRDFLIKDDLEKIKWEIGSETKKIGDYVCKKALAKVDNNNIIAWYAEEIPLNDGPREFWGLPGLILEVDNGKRVITCSKISFNKKGFIIEPPNKGKEVTREEFDQIADKKVKSMTGGQGEGGGKVHIINGN